MEAQNDFKELQKAGISPVQIGIALALGASAVLVNYWPEILFYLLVAGGAGLAAWTAAERKREAREASARAASYANICGPVIIASTHPGETVEEVAARANAFREQMRIGGNPYWLQIPVEAYPYNPMIYGVGQLTAAWNIYQRMAGERQHQANLEWSEKCPAQLKAIFLSQVMPQPAAQTEVA